MSLKKHQNSQNVESFKSQQTLPLLNIFHHSIEQCDQANALSKNFLNKSIAAQSDKKYS